MKYMPRTCCSKSICYIRIWSQMGWVPKECDIFGTPKPYCFPHAHKWSSSTMFLKICEISSHHWFHVFPEYPHVNLHEFTKYGWLMMIMGRPIFGSPEYFCCPWTWWKARFSGFKLIWLKLICILLVFSMAHVRTNPSLFYLDLFGSSCLYSNHP